VGTHSKRCRPSGFGIRTRVLAVGSVLRATRGADIICGKTPCENAGEVLFETVGLEDPAASVLVSDLSTDFDERLMCHRLGMMEFPRFRGHVTVRLR
jgi:hypothetical protein